MNKKEIAHHIMHGGSFQKELAFQTLLTGSLKRSAISISTYDSKHTVNIELCHITFMDWVFLKKALDDKDPNHSFITAEPLMFEKRFSKIKIPMHYSNDHRDFEKSNSVVGNHLTTTDQENNERHFYFYYIEDIKMFTIVQGINKGEY